MGNGSCFGKKLENAASAGDAPFHLFEGGAHGVAVGRIGSQFQVALPGGCGTGRIVEVVGQDDAQVEVGVEVGGSVLDGAAEGVGGPVAAPGAAVGDAQIGAGVGVGGTGFEVELVVLGRLVVVAGVEEGVSQAQAGVEVLGIVCQVLLESVDRLEFGERGELRSAGVAARAGAAGAADGVRLAWTRTPKAKPMPRSSRPLPNSLSGVKV